VNGQLSCLAEAEAGLARELPCLCQSLPPLLRDWIARQAEKMGLPSPENYLLLLVRMEKQRQALAAVEHLIAPSRPAERTASMRHAG